MWHRCALHASASDLQIVRLRADLRGSCLHVERPGQNGSSIFQSAQKPSIKAHSTLPQDRGSLNLRAVRKPRTAGGNRPDEPAVPALGFAIPVASSKLRQQFARRSRVTPLRRRKYKMEVGFDLDAEPMQNETAARVSDLPKATFKI